ncbi:hypothetical protein Syun_013188 [Stephania yunnanensis]|uniref:Short-chain dehydrogenase TIC 32, chloroplastic n=1 Tax=Stephania yunnanensis TaxID=152371 RepID=A0AAP0K0V9_9MAGN
MWFFGRKGASGFSASSTAEEVTEGIDGTGLTAIVTGASAGIGAETSRVLALRGVHVVMGVRNMAAARDVKQAIIKDNSKAKVDMLELDLSSLASVRKFASEFNSSGLPLNILLAFKKVGSNDSIFFVGGSNNAGILAPPFKLSQDGIELQFATNHLGHFLLTNLLLDTLKRTAKRSKVEGRIVNVSSNAHRYAFGEGIPFNKINDEPSYNRMWVYGQTKLANILHSNELARRLKEEGVQITANSVHPGLVYTNIFKHQSLVAGLVDKIKSFACKTVQQGAATTCYVALHPQVKGVSGKFFVDCNIATPSSLAQDSNLAKKLWERKGASGFSYSSTAEEVTQGIDGSGLTAIVTGASSGIGAETTRVMASRGVHVVMAARNIAAARSVKEEVVKEIPAAKVDILELDLMSMASVRKFAQEFKSLNLPLNILVSNGYPFYALPGQDRDAVCDKPHRFFQNIMIGHFLLTNLLLETMKSTARESNIEGRIVNVSSEAHRFPYPEGIRFDKINDETCYSSWRAYGQSKLANVLHANELTRRLKLLILLLYYYSAALSLSIVNAVGKFFLKNVQQGAATTCYVALHPQVKGVSGKYFADSNLGKASSHGQDSLLAKRLWDFSLSLTN